jgi:ankyrin repeat protein
MNFLHGAVKTNDIKKLEILLTKLNKSDIDEDMLDALNEIDPIIAKDVDYGIARKRFKWTLLHSVCYFGHLEVFNLLIDKFNALKGKDKHYITQLSHLAINRGGYSIWCKCVESLGAEF